jgi:hypothetical protein
LVQEPREAVDGGRGITLGAQFVDPSSHVVSAEPYGPHLPKLVAHASLQPLPSGASTLKMHQKCTNSQY